VDSTSGEELRIREATPSDVPTVLALIRELASYEKLADQVVAREDDLRAALFAPRPFAECLLAETGSEVVGFALFFHTFSTFLARPGLYLEDLFVRPAMRRRGVGRALFTHLARLAVARGCGRFEWSALNWNEPALNFYRGQGAVPLSDWTMFRLAGEDLRRVGR
jgi:GNAT superfamily N-acetyltransferase